MPEIGKSLREARMSARIDVSEIEGKTKIRAKYLRALENEEWGLLPGPTLRRSWRSTGCTTRAPASRRSSRSSPARGASADPASREVAEGGAAPRAPMSSWSDSSRC